MTNFLRLATLYIEFGKYGVEWVDLHNTVASRIRGVSFFPFSSLYYYYLRLTRH
jgi:hypothetical protein